MSSAGNNEQRSLPPGWRTARLKEVCRVVSGSTPKSGVSDYWDGEIAWITPTDLGKLAGTEIHASERRITKAGYESCGTDLVPVGAVVMSSRAPIGHLGVARVPLCTNQGCKSFLPSSILDSQFLFWFLKKSVPELQELGSGATFREVSKTQVEEFEIALPPVNEQKRIGAILNEQMATVERARAATEAQLEAARTLPAAYLRAVFNSPGAQQWPEMPLVEVCKITARQVDPKIREFAELPHISAENIEGGTCRLLFLRTAAEDGMTSGKYLFEPGDVLYSKLRPYLRKVVVVDFRGVCSADMYPIRVNKELITPQYLAWLLLSDAFTEYADAESRRARMPKLNRDQLFAWKAPIPPLREQQSIAMRLAAAMTVADRTRRILVERLEEIKKLPGAILRRAFNGEL